MAITIGTAGDDTLTASQDGDVLIGRDGNDTLQYPFNFHVTSPNLGTVAMFGDGGDDSLTVLWGWSPHGYRVSPRSFLDGGNGSDTVAGGADRDTIDGGDGNDSLAGGGYDDSISGGGGNDTIDGGGGSDSVAGGPGNDVYVLAEVTDSTERTGFSFQCPSPSCYEAERDLIHNTGYDYIYGFDNPGPAAGDRIDLSRIDPHPDQPGNQAFKFAGEWTDAIDPRGVGKVWVFDADWGDVTVVQGWIGEDVEWRSTEAPIGDWFQIFIFDGDTRAADYTADDFSLVPREQILAAEPDAFPAGTVLTNAYPGVTLTVQAPPGRQTMVVESVSGFDPLQDRNLATTGSLVFGRVPADVPRWWDENDLGLFRGDFSQPASHVSIDLIFDDDDIGYLKAFDAAGNLLAEVTGCGDGRGDIGLVDCYQGTYVRASIDRPQADIAYFLAGGIPTPGTSRGESLLLDNLHYGTLEPVVTEIDATADVLLI